MGLVVVGGMHAPEPFLARRVPEVCNTNIAQNDTIAECCSSHNLNPGGKAQPTCSGTRTELHLTNLKHLRVKKLCQTGTFTYWAQMAPAINKGEASSDMSCVGQQDQNRRKCTEQ